MTTVTIPSTVTQIQDWAFYLCAKLSTAYFEGDAPSYFGSAVFDGTARNFNIFFKSTNSGFSEPTWNGYQCYPRYLVIFVAGSHGVVNGTTSQIVNRGSSSTPVTAETSSSGYKFIGWTGDYAGTANPLTLVNVVKDMVVTANFDIDRSIDTNVTAIDVPEEGTAVFKVRLCGPPEDQVVVTVARTSGDTDITVSSGSTLTFTSENWNVYQDVTLAAAKDADAVNGSAVITCSAPGLVSTTVSATEIDNDYTLKIIVEGSGTTDPSGSKVVQKGVSQGVTATPAEGCHFLKWTVTSGSGVFSNELNEFTFFTASANATIKASFTKNINSLTISKLGNGSTSPAVGTMDVTAYAPLRIIATAAANWHFIQWTLSGAGTFADINAASTTLTLTGIDGATAGLQAEFEHNKASLGISNDGNGTTDPATGTLIVDTVTPIPIKATVVTPNYHFEKWIVSGGAKVAAPASAETTVSLTSNGSVKANFAHDTAALTMARIGGKSVTPAPGTSTVLTVTQVPITAAETDPRYPFVNWTVSGAAVIDDPDSASTSVALSGNAVVTANFIMPALSGTAIASFSGIAGTCRQYKMNVPDGQNLLEARTYGGKGDCDLEVVGPDGIVAGRSSGAGTNELVQITDPAGGDWIFRIYGHAAYTGAGFVAKYYDKPPAVPSGLLASDGLFEDMVAVSWKTVPGATSYKIFRNTTKLAPVEGDRIAETSDNIYEDRDVAANTVYYYFVTAINGAGSSKPTAFNSGFVMNTPSLAPAAPTASDGLFFDRINIKWTKVAAAASYLVFRTGDALSVPDPLVDVPLAETSALSYDDYGDDLDPRDGAGAKFYYYWIAASNLNGIGPISKCNAGYLSRKGPATITAGNGTYSDKVTVSWAAVPGATSYDVYRYTDKTLLDNDMTFEKIIGTSYDDTTAPPDTIFYYRVKAKYGFDDPVVYRYDSDFSPAVQGQALASGKSYSATSVDSGDTSAVLDDVAGGFKYFSIEVPFGTTRIVAVLDGSPVLANDCDLFAKFANYPTKSSYVAKGVEAGTVETITVSNPAAGTWYFLLYGTKAYSGVTLKITCYSVADIVLTAVPDNNLPVPFTAVFAGRVVDGAGTGIPNMVVKARNPINGLVSILTKSDAKGMFKYSAPVNSEGEHTFDFFFENMPDAAKGTASHTVASRKGHFEINGYFDMSCYLPAEPVAVPLQDDIVGLQNFLDTRNGWGEKAIVNAYETMWIDSTMGKAEDDTKLADKLDEGLYMFFYGVEGAGVGNDTTATSALSAVPFMVHVSTGRQAEVLANLKAIGIIDGTQESDIGSGGIGLIAIASIGDPDEAGTPSSISLLASEQLELLAKIAGNTGNSDITDVTYSGIAAKQFSVAFEGGRRLSVVAAGFVK